MNNFSHPNLFERQVESLRKSGFVVDLSSLTGRSCCVSISLEKEERLHLIVDLDNYTAPPQYFIEDISEGEEITPEVELTSIAQWRLEPSIRKVVSEVIEIRKVLAVQGFEELKRQLESAEKFSFELSETSSTIDGFGEVTDHICRYLNVAFPDCVQVDSPAPLRIQFLCRKPHYSETQPIYFEIGRLAESMGFIPISVLISYDEQDFTCGRSSIRRINVPLKRDSQPVVFEMMPKSWGHKTFYVEFYRDGNYIARKIIHTLVKEETSVYPVGNVEVINFSGQQSSPDLTIRFQKVSQRNGDQEFYLTLISDKLPDTYHKNVGRITLQAPHKYMGEVFRGLNEASYTSGEDDSLLNKRIEGIGCSLYEQLFPDQLKNVYWEYIREHVRTLLIISDDPWIPWELLRPWRKLSNGRIEVDEFLCERFVLTRWLAESNTPAVGSLNFNPVNLVVDSSMAFADEEVEILRNIMNLQVRDIACDRSAMYRMFEDSDFRGLHIICHGKFNSRNPDLSALCFDDGLFYPSDISGSTQSFGRNRPLIFINACDVAQQGIALTGIGGWVQAFVRAGCGAFISSTWEANSESAYKFAKAFYNYLLDDNNTIAEAVRLARLEIKKDGNPTWLSYSVYGHPETKVTLAESQEK